MANINYDSIMRKLGVYMNSAKMQNAINERVDRYMLGKISIALSKKRPVPPEYIADRFIEVFRKEVASHAIGEGGGAFSNGALGPTAIAALDCLEHGDPHPVGKRKYTIGIYFEKDLSRESLRPEKYGGVGNIAALLNSGYSAGHAVRGVWKGHGNEPIYSLVKRGGAHFIEDAISNFMGNYGSEYGVIDIKVDDVYK